MIIQNTLKLASKILKHKNITSHQLDAEIILADLMGVKREFFILNNKLDISEPLLKKYNYAISRRSKYEPVAYITGKKEFWSEDFLLNKSTLIPRPETELLIYKVISVLKNKKLNILDIGTGSGCILLSILKELNFSRGIGIDISSKAIHMAKINSKNMKLVNRSSFKVVDLKNFNLGRYDLIVSNPPYIQSRDIKNLSKDIINYEPLSALNGGIDGLDLIKKVIYKSNFLLKKKGMLALEIGHNQYKKVSYILKSQGYREMSKVYDYKDNVRCIISTKVNFINFKK